MIPLFFLVVRVLVSIVSALAAANAALLHAVFLSARLPLPVVVSFLPLAARASLVVFSVFVVVVRFGVHWLVVVRPRSFRGQRHKCSKHIHKVQ